MPPDGPHTSTGVDMDGRAAVKLGTGRFHTFPKHAPHVPALWGASFLDALADAGPHKCEFFHLDRVVYTIANV